MSLNHDFLLVDRALDGEWEPMRFVNDPRAIQMPDDLVWYMFDTLKWIPTHNPSTKTACRGLNMVGPTLIEQDGAGIAKRVFQAWADLFSNGPHTLELTGAYSWVDGRPVGTGEYEHLEYSRDDTVEVLQAVANYAAEIQIANGRLYLYHGGI